MSKEILQVAEAVSNEKGVSQDVIFEAIEAALASAAKKRHSGGEDIDVQVIIDRRSGDYATYRVWKVVGDDVDLDALVDAAAAAAADDAEPPPNPAQLIRFSDARELDPEAVVDGRVRKQIPNADFGRIAAQTAKQVIVQKVREAERAQIVDAYIGRKGELVSGIVKRIERGSVYLDLGSNVEALIPREQMIPREPVRNGDRMRGYLQDVRSEPRGPQLFVSRTDAQLLIALFSIEVPEVGQGLIEIKGAARDPGVRAKIAVKSNDMRIDPVGACVGMRGSRVQNVSNELAGERVDIVLWDDNPAQFVINAMSPAEVVSIVVDEDSHSMDIAVSEDKLSQAIGRGGQNVRLASELTGWELNVMTEEQAREKISRETDALQTLFTEQLGVDEEVAAVLVREGFASFEEIAYVPIQEMLEVPEFDEEVVEALRGRARDALLARAIADEGKLDDVEPAEDLLTMEGMQEDLAYLLAGKGVVTMEDLAELAVDDLTEITDLDAEQAAKLIMTARAPWFADENS